MHPILVAIGTLGFVAGVTISFKIGYDMDEWISKLFSYRFRSTDTRLVVEPKSVGTVGLNLYEPKHIYQNGDKIHENCDNCRKDYYGNVQSHIHQVYNNPIAHTQAYLNEVKESFEDRNIFEEPEDHRTFADNMKYVKPRERDNFDEVEGLLEGMGDKQKEWVLHELTKGMKWGVEKLPERPLYSIEDL